jgi:hypothetical protein
MTGATRKRGGGQECLCLTQFSIALTMVLECFVCDERLGLCRVYVKYGTNE